MSESHTSVPSHISPPAQLQAFLQLQERHRCLPPAGDTWDAEAQEKLLHGAANVCEPFQGLKVVLK